MNILCFGDSNTFGYDPRDFFGGCYDAPWPALLAKMSGWSVQNLGENGREIPGYPISFPKEFDVLIVMLGTNDLLRGSSPKDAAKRMEAFLKSIDIESSKIVLIAPPAMKPGAWVPERSLLEASKELAAVYQRLSQRLGVRFADAAQWNVPLAFDGVHFTQEGHRTFAAALKYYLDKGE